LIFLNRQVPHPVNVFVFFFLCLAAALSPANLSVAVLLCDVMAYRDTGKKPFVTLSLYVSL
jgi:hypothetical protein